MLRKDIRTFVPYAHSIGNANPPARPLPGPQKFSLEKRLRDSFGVHSGEGQHEVIIRFDAKVADYVREKKWHESQKLRELKTGEVELSLTLSSLVEIERWVLGWGGDATVMKPVELRETIRDSARRILSKDTSAEKTAG